MLRLALLTLLATALALPATSLAKDPLLSGYGGPGGGEQALLGSQLTGGGAHGGGGGGTAGGASTAGTTAATGLPASSQPGNLRVLAPATGGSVAASSPKASAPGKRSGRAKRGGGTKHQAGARGGTQGSAATPTAAPRPVAYPTRADDAGGLPFSAAELLLGALVLVAIAGLGAWLRRTAPHDGDPGAQAPA